MGGPVAEYRAVGAMLRFGRLGYTGREIPGIPDSPLIGRTPETEDRYGSGKASEMLAQLDAGAIRQFDGMNGFLGTRGSIMLDFVFLAMFAIVPVLLLSICLVRFGRKYQLHKTIQLLLGGALLVAVTAFEVDMRFFTDWEQRAAPSPYYSAEGWSGVWITLVVHLGFAIPTTVLWGVVIGLALRKFARPPAPNPHSRLHVPLAWLATVGMFMTAVTGWVFYWLAFVA
jgi:putative membrane protein